MKCVLVIGDIMLDHYIEGQAWRLSPEAPVPVVRVERDRFVLGGAANVAANVVSLGGSVILVGVLGKDPVGKRTVSEACSRGIDVSNVLWDPDRPSTEKCRVVSGRHQIARYDREDCVPISRALLSDLRDRITSLIGTYDAVIISDYAKGMIVPDVFNQSGLFGDVPVIVDPKQQGFERFCPIGSILKPNKSEAEAETRVVIKSMEDALTVSDILLRKIDGHAAYVTLGEWGGALSAARGIRQIVPTRRVAVYDPTGAGDTAAAALALGLATGKNIVDAAYDANLAASVSVTIPGTIAVSWPQIRELVAAEE